MNTYPRETVEFLALEVTVDGTATTTYEVCVTKDGERPLAWVANVALDGKHGVMVQGRTPGLHTIWVRITDNPEIPVINAGSIRID